MLNIREMLNVEKMKLLAAIREIDTAVGALNGSQIAPAKPAKAAKASYAEKPKRVVTEETKAKMRAAHAARKAKANGESFDHSPKHDAE